MKNKDTMRQSTFSVIYITVIVTTIMMIVYFLRGIYPFGSFTIVKSDLAQQFVPEDFYYLWDVLHGKASLFFTWQVGSGIDLAGVASHRAFLSPLNLFLLFSTRRNLLYYSDIMLIMKMICVAISMYFYSNKYKIDNVYRVIGSIIYAFGAASVVYYTIYFTIDAAFVLPLVMIGVDRVITADGRKSRPGFFIIICAYMLVIDIYSGLLTFVFLFYSGFLKLRCFDIESEKRKQQSLIFTFSVIIAVFISAVISYPALRAIINSARNSVQTSLVQTYHDILCANQDEVEDKGILLINMAFPIWLIGWNTIHKKNRISKYKYHIIMTMLLIGSIFIPATELLWHGGSRIYFPVRYIYVISFELVDYMYTVLTDKNSVAGYICKVSLPIRRIAKILIFLMVMVTSGYLLIKIQTIYTNCSFYKTLGNRTAIVGIAILMCIIYSICIYLNRGRYLIYFIILEILCSTTYILSGDADATQYITDSQVLADSLSEQTNELGRIKNYDHSLNDDYPFIMGKQSIANYAHAIDRNLQPTFKNLGYSSVWTRLEDVGGTVFTDSLLNYRYMVGTHDLEPELYSEIGNINTGNAEFYLYKAKYSFPYAIFDSKITNFGLENDLFENQNILYADLIDKNDQIITDITGLINNNTLTYKAIDKCVLYMYRDGAENGQLNVSVNGKPVKWNDGTYPSTFDNAMVNLGYFENENIRIDIEDTGTINFVGLHIGILNLSKLQKLITYEDNAGKVTSVNYSKSGITIDYNAVQDGYVLLPIAYNNGWKCKVNRQNTICRSDYGLTAITVTQGVNHIDIKYQSPYLLTGIFLTVFGIITCFVSMYVVKNDYRSRYCERVAYDIYKGLFVCMTIVMYIIPLFSYFILYLY